MGRVIKYQVIKTYSGQMFETMTTVDSVDQAMEVASEYLRNRSSIAEGYIVIVSSEELPT